MLDGKFISDLIATDDESAQVKIRTNNYQNGQHFFKVILLYDGQIVTSSKLECIFNNDLSSITQAKGLESGKNYFLQAISENNFSIVLYDIVSEAVTFSGFYQNGLNVCIPSTAFTLIDEGGIYDLDINKQALNEQTESETGLLSDNPKIIEDKISYVLTRKFNPMDTNYNQYVKMVISIGSEDLQQVKEKCWKSAVKASVAKGIRPVILKYEDCTWDNLIA